MSSKTKDFFTLTRSSNDRLSETSVKWVEEPGNIKVGIAFLPSSEVKLVFEGQDGAWKVVANATHNDIESLNAYIRNGRPHGTHYPNAKSDF